MVFLIEHTRGVVACVLQGQQTHLHMESVGPKVSYRKIPVFLMTILLEYYNQTYEENFLKKKWECIKNTNSPRLIRRYSKESKSIVKSKLSITYQGKQVYSKI